jgi:hypothetical protein
MKMMKDGNRGFGGGSSSREKVTLLKDIKVKSPQLDVSLEKTLATLGREITATLGERVHVVDTVRKPIEHSESYHFGIPRDNNHRNMLEIEERFKKDYRGQDVDLCFIKDKYFTVGVIYQKP